MEFLDGTAGRLAYHDSAPGRRDLPVVVALHASAASGRQWRGLAAQLTPHWRVVAPDMIGYGATPMTGTAQLDDEMALLTTLAARLDGPFHLVGHSYGGAMALELACRLPQRIASIAVYEPVAFATLRESARSDAGHDEAWAEIASLARRQIGLVETGDLSAAAAVFLDYWIGPGALSAMPAELQQYITGCMGKVATELGGIFTAPIVPDHFAALTMPVLLASGSRTTLAARSVVALLRQQLADPRWSVQPGLGHMAPVTAAEQINRLFADFLAEMASGRAIPAA